MGNIKHEILYTGLSEEEASKLEADLIKKYKSNNYEYGYNIANGGFTKGIYTVSEDIRNKIRDKNKGRKVSDKTKDLMKKNRKDTNAHGWGHSPNKQSRKLVSMKIQGIKRSNESKLKMAKQKEKKVYQYDLEGNLLKEWNSAKEINHQLKYNFGNIGAVCHFRVLTAMGFFWSFDKINDANLIKKYLNKEIHIPVLSGGKAKKVIQYDLSHNELKCFDSLQEASLFTGISSQQISYACKNKTVTGIYRWKYDTSTKYYGDNYFLYWANNQDKIK